MSVTHHIGDHDFTVEVYWPTDRRFHLIYSIDGIKVTKEQFLDGLCDEPAEVPDNPDVWPDDGGTESD